MAKEVAPQLGLDSYSCPHCGALAHQFWFHVYVDSFKKGEGPSVIPLQAIENFVATLEGDDDGKMIALLERSRKHEVTYESLQYGSSSHWRMMNLFIGRCHACEGFAIWIKDKLIWPVLSLEVEPHQDMPGVVKEDFIEAARIVQLSPRGSAALSRMILQKLMAVLGEKGDNINEDIGSLVKKGLEIEIQQALDVVRVIGNNAVHPGKIDIKDDSATAMTLLQLINLVIERRIATQKRIAEMFASLPSGTLDQIKARDGTSTS
jgi:hypothetical protein